METLDSVAAYDFPSAADAPAQTATVLLTWRTPARRRWSCIAWSLLALSAAIAVEVTGPQRPVAFGARLPLIVAVCGALWCTVRWRRRVLVTTADVVVRTLLRTRRLPHGAAAAEAIARAEDGHPLPGRLRIPVPSQVPMMTPCLVISAALVVALGTAKVLTVAPRMSVALVVVSAGACIAALAACFRLDRGVEPRKAATSAASANAARASAARASAVRARRGLGMSGNR